MIISYYFTKLLPGSSELGDCYDQKGFSGLVFLSVYTIVFNFGIFTQETGGKIA